MGTEQVHELSASFSVLPRFRVENAGGVGFGGERG
jgi:hypothetical protein